MINIDDFEKTWETEYLCNRVKRIGELVKEDRYEYALEYLKMIQQKAQLAEILIERLESNKDEKEGLHTGD